MLSLFDNTDTTVGFTITAYVLFLFLVYFIVFNYIIFTRIGPLSTRKQDYPKQGLEDYAESCAILAVVLAVVVSMVLGLMGFLVLQAA